MKIIQIRQLSNVILLILATLISLFYLQQCLPNISECYIDKHYDFIFIMVGDKSYPFSLFESSFSFIISVSEICFYQTNMNEFNLIEASATDQQKSTNFYGL
jgi:hypothetical protein